MLSLLKSPDFLVPGYLVIGYLCPVNPHLHIILNANLLLTIVDSCCRFSAIAILLLATVVLSIQPVSTLPCCLAHGYLVSATLPPTNLSFATLPQATFSLPLATLSPYTAHVSDSLPLPTLYLLPFPKLPCLCYPPPAKLPLYPTPGNLVSDTLPMATLYLLPLP
jgi:hypothetical protein